MLGNPVFTLTIKLGSLLPDGSPWNNALKKMAVEWQEISNGLLILKIFPGGIAGDEQDMLRKMRINQLQAAGLTGIGLYHITPSVLAIQLPMFIRNENELNYVIEMMRADFEREMERKGFKLIIWIMAGWAHFFARKPVITPDDLKNQKLHVPAGNTTEISALKKIGFHVVPLPINDVIHSLQSGMVEAFIGTPLTAAVFQWFGLAKNMCGLRWAPIIGGIVVSVRTWEQIPADLRPKLLEAALKLEKALRAETIRVEQKALEIMKENGLVIHPVTPEVEKEWHSVVEQGFNLIIGKSLDWEIYNRAKSHLKDFRMQNVEP